MAGAGFHSVEVREVEGDMQYLYYWARRG